MRFYVDKKEKGKKKGAKHHTERRLPFPQAPVRRNAKPKKHH